MKLLWRKNDVHIKDIHRHWRRRPKWEETYSFSYFPVLSLFTVVQWPNSAGCSTPSGEYGSCLPNNDCQLRGGIPGGGCAGGYGICCVCKSKLSVLIPNSLTCESLPLQLCPPVVVLLERTAAISSTQIIRMWLTAPAVANWRFWKCILISARYGESGIHSRHSFLN